MVVHEKHQAMKVHLRHT